MLVKVAINNFLSIKEEQTIKLNKDVATSLDLKQNQVFLVNKYKMQASYYKTSELRKILEELCNLDYNYKVGLIDLELGFESILCAYC